MNIIKFTSDTKHRKQWFTGISFSHPAKMSLPLQLWLIENFTKEGETILDPMAGSGTILVACSMGRHVICVELEQKFIDMMKGNWEKIQQRGAQMGYEMGTATILQGDARNLAGILADKIITSPPFGNATKNLDDIENWDKDKANRIKELQGLSKSMMRPYSENPSNIGNLPYGNIDKIISSPPYAEMMDGGSRHTKGGIPQRDLKMKGLGAYPTDSLENIGNKPYGSIDAVISSPPYEGTLDGTGEGPLVTSKQNKSYKPMPSGYTEKVDAVISSPPYEGSVSASTGGERDQSSARQREARLKNKGYDPAKYQGGVGRNLEADFQYSKADDNIGNLKSDSYLQAMLQVYQNCFSVLKDGGLMILVTKNFIRNKQQVRLDLDTIKLCEQVGFTFQDRWYRELASQSFWRIIYQQKYPDVEPIKYEDILVFVRGIT